MDLSSQSSTPNVPSERATDGEFDDKHGDDNASLATTYGSQIHYCQMCQGFIEFLKSIYFAFSKVKSTYKLEVDTIRSGMDCCLCMLILRICGHWFEDERFPQLKTLTVTKAEYECFHLSYGEFVEPLWISHLEVNDPRWFSYEHHVTVSTDSDECWDLACRWLQNCKSGHTCGETDVSCSLPTRLVKVNASSQNFHPSLVETAALPGRVEYCTLSHCWGDFDFLKLTRANYEEFCRLIPYNSLSKTFQDAIYAAYRLGFEYIWIDSHCIIQNDEDDWGREATTMGNVYAGSSFNLSATSSVNGLGGLFRTRNPQAVLPCLFNSGTSPFEDSCVHISL